MDTRRRRHRSQLFTVRLWLEDLGDCQAEWRGEIQHVEGGERRYFRDWSGLVECLLAMLHRPDGDRRPAGHGDATPPERDT